MAIDFGSRWYVAQTHPHCERKACAHLARQGFVTYLPRYLKQRRHARRLDQIAAPLFPRYIFVALDLAAQRWLSADSTIGVVKLIRNGNTPAPLPQSVVEALKAREDTSGFIQLIGRPAFLPGDKIKVLRGAFSDCCGLYEGMSNRERVAILLDILGRKARTFVSIDAIEAA
jgi:transcriptional antiterminator RfaH